MTDSDKRCAECGMPEGQSIHTDISSGLWHAFAPTPQPVEPDCEPIVGSKYMGAAVAIHSQSSGIGGDGEAELEEWALVEAERIYQGLFAMQRAAPNPGWHQNDVRWIAVRLLDVRDTPPPPCVECHKPMAVVRHCLTDDCCANVGEESRWSEAGFERGVHWACRVIEHGVPGEAIAFPRLAALRDRLLRKGGG